MKSFCSWDLKCSDGRKGRLISELLVEVYDFLLSSYMLENYLIREVIFFVEEKEISLHNVDLKKMLIISKSKNSNYTLNECIAYISNSRDNLLIQMISNQELEKIIRL